MSKAPASAAATGLPVERTVHRFRMVGDTMSPRYEKGDVVFVELDAPAREGGDALIELHDDAGWHVLRLILLTDTTIVAMQLKPPREISLDQRDIKRLCRVLAIFDLTGEAS